MGSRCCRCFESSREERPDVPVRPATGDSATELHGGETAPAPQQVQPTAPVPAGMKAQWPPQGAFNRHARWPDPNMQFGNATSEYVIGKFLADSTAIVYECHPVSQPNKVRAVKIYDPQDKADCLQDFRADAACFDGLKGSENDVYPKDGRNLLVQTFDKFEANIDGCHFLVMERVKDEKSEADLLQELVTLKDGFDEEVAKDIFEQLVFALQCVHKHDYIHRDLKPENILIESSYVQDDKKYYNIKLTDFGIARRVHPKLAIARTHLGTINMKPPEIEDHDGLYNGKAVDMWGLGVILFTMVFGEGFPGPKIANRNGRLNIPPNSNWHTKHLSDDVKDLIEKLLRWEADPAGFCARINMDELHKHPWLAEMPLRRTPTCREQIQQEKHTFEPGQMGLVCDDDGTVQEVIENGPGHTKGIKKGNVIVNVNFDPYSKDALAHAEKSGMFSQVTFRVSRWDSSRPVFFCQRLQVTEQDCDGSFLQLASDFRGHGIPDNEFIESKCLGTATICKRQVLSIVSMGVHVQRTQPKTLLRHGDIVYYGVAGKLSEVRPEKTDLHPEFENRLCRNEGVNFGLMECVEFRVKSHMNKCVIGGEGQRGGNTSLGWIRFRNNFGGLTIAILKRADGEQRFYPMATEILYEGDVLLIPRRFMDDDKSYPSASPNWRKRGSLNKKEIEDEDFFEETIAKHAVNFESKAHFECIVEEGEACGAT